MQFDQLDTIDSYDTPSDSKRMLGDILCFKTRAFFFLRVLKLIMDFSSAIRKGKFSNLTWCNASYYIFKTIEGCGGKIHIRGLNNIDLANGPVVFIGNHMSSLETFVIPGLVCPKKPATFVVKESLMTMPRFGEIMKASKAIAVGRQSPAEDFKAVMKEGKELIKAGTSIIIFPQHTRGVEFIPEQFNSIGVKLAKNAGVPIIPIALKSDFWGNGKLVKDFGPLHREKEIYFEFGAPIIPDSNGKFAHQQIVYFIQEKLKEWKNR